MRAGLRVLPLLLMLCSTHLYAGDFEYAQQELETEPVEIDEEVPGSDSEDHHAATNETSLVNSVADAVKITGKIEHFQSLRLNEPFDFFGSRSMLDLVTYGSTEHTLLYGNIRAEYNSIIPEHTGFELREAYVNYNGDFWDIQIGRQIFVWGKADSIVVTDVISPRDYSEFLTLDVEERRRPVDAVRGRLLFDTSILELVMVTVFSPSVLPLPGTPWFPETSTSFETVMEEENVDTDSVTYDDIAEQPPLRASSIQAGGRLQMFLAGFDMSLSAFYLYDSLPVLKKDYELDTDTPHRSSLLEYRRYLSTGGAFSFTAGQLVFRGEIAFYWHKHLMRNFHMEDMLLPENDRPDPTSRHHIFKGLFGIDWNIGSGWNATVQVADEIIMNYNRYLLTDQSSFLATAHLSKSLFREQLLFTAQAYYAHGQKTLFSRIKADWSVFGGLHFMLGFDLFVVFSESEAPAAGYDTNKIIQQYGNNDSVWIKAAYDF